MEPARVFRQCDLFASCLEALDKVQADHPPGTDSNALDTRFKTTRERLERWGRSVGVWETGVLRERHADPGEGDAAESVEYVLGIIDTIRDATNAPSLHKGDSTSAFRPPPLPGARRQKLNWAFWGKGKKAERIKLFENLVQLLHDLVPLGGAYPPAWGRGASPVHAPVAELQKIKDRIEEKKKAETRREIYARLGSGIPGKHYHDSIQKRLDGTCNWIFEHKAFQTWLSPELPLVEKLLWINGPAGFGKTILCASIVQHLQSTLQTPVAHFFFSFELENREDPFIAIRSWISQVVSQNEQAFEHAHQIWEHESDLVASNMKSITLFTQLLGVVPNCTFIVDGLDECTHLDDGKASVANFLRNVIDAIAGTSTRLLIVSRDEPQIREAIMYDEPEVFRECRISPKNVRSDTAIVSRVIVDRKLPKESDVARSTLSEMMVHKCEGQFIWLRILEESLREKGTNLEQLRHAVEETPAGLDEIYSRNWSRISSSLVRARIYSLLRWAAFALRPLTVYEIIEAVHIGDFDDPAMGSLPDNVDDGYVDREISGLCGTFIQVRSHQCERSKDSIGQQTVHLAHFSVKQFLLLNLPKPDWILGNERLQAEYQNTLLAEASLCYINLRRVWQDTTYHPSSLGTALREYAAASWYRHAKYGIPGDDRVSSLAIRFFDRSNPAWNAWSTWFDEQGIWKKDSTAATEPGDPADEPEVSPDISPAPFYYAVKLELTEVATAMIKDQDYEADRGNGLRLSAFAAAGQSGGKEVLRMLLDAGLDVSAADKDGRTLLYTAVLLGRPEAVDVLIANGAEVMSEYRNGWTPLHYACGCGHAEAAELLVSNGADINAKTTSGWAALHLALRYGYVEISKLLIQSGADITAATTDGWTALHFALRYGYVEASKLLIEKGADIMAATAAGWTALHLASEYGYPEIVKMLLENGASTASATNGTNGGGGAIWTPLHCASKNGHVDVSRLLIQAGASVTATTPWMENFPLHLAAMNGHVEVVELLTLKGASLAAPTRSRGDTPLHLACQYGHAKVAELLISRGASISHTTNNGAMPLHYACIEGYPEVVNLLIQNGASITAVIGKEYTPLHLASAKGHVEIAKLLIEKGASVSQADRDGATSLHHACCYGHLEVVKLLIESGANTSHTDEDGWTLLHYTVTEGHSEVVRLLIDKGSEADVNAVAGQSRETPLHFASLWGYNEVVKALLTTSGIDPNRTTNLGCTPLFFASRVGCESIVQTLLVDRRTNLGIKDWNGSTALFTAVRNGHLKVVEALLTTGHMKPEGEDGFGRSLFWWARRTGNSQLFQLLEHHAEKSGCPVSNDAAGVEAKPVRFSEEDNWCDACTRSIPDGEENLCEVCQDDDFHLCAECFPIVTVECCDGIHVRTA
ncbi:hypothetical protein ACHAPT_012828 [Fusarium lateritium]